MTPRRLRASLAIAAAVAGFALSGCSGDNPASPAGFTQADADDIAAQAAQALTAGTLPGMAAAQDASDGMSGSPAAPFPDGREAGSMAAAETTFTIGDITYTLAVTFFDGDGNPLAGYGPTAERMLVASRATGTVTRPQFNATLGHAATLDVTGIGAADDTLAFTGAAHDSVEATFQSLDGTRTRYFTWVSAATLANVRLLRDRAINPFPLSGTAMYTVHAVRYRSNPMTEVEKTWDAVVVVVFDGTATPDLTVNGTFRYGINLMNGAVVRR